ncbi:G2/mitotic-specific cyclin, partial [Coemansia spiralis]
PVQVAGTKRRASSAGPDDARVVRARTSRSVSAAPVERPSSARSDATAVDSAEAAKELAARAESDYSVFEPSGAESQKTAVEDLEQQEAIFNRPMAKPRRAFSTVRSLSRPVGLDLPEPKESETPKDWDDIDAEDKDDPLMVSEYVKEIFEYMRECEERTQADEHYMTNQPDLSWDMRRVLMNWIVQIHYQLRMLPETLFLAVNLIDRFLSKCKVSTSKLQLVGMTGLILACKYEETTTPHVDDFAFLAGNCYSVAEIRNTEVFMLRVLDFDMSFPSPMTFLRRVSKAEQYNMQTRTVAKYLMEVSLIDHRFMLYPPSQIAAAGICLARRMLHAGPWDGNLRHHSGYTEESLRLCIDLMLDELLYPGDHDFVYRKYTHKRYLRASIFCRDWVVRHRHEIPPAGPPVGDFPDPELIAQSLLF